MGEAPSEAFKQMFSFGHMGENDVAFMLKDPENNLVDLQVRDASGAPVKYNGRMSINDTHTIHSARNPGRMPRW